MPLTSTPARRVSRRADAKVNLTLSVGPPNSVGTNAGFHPIASWFSCINLSDDIDLIQLAPGSPSDFRISWADDAPILSPIDWPIHRDLAFRAHSLLEAETQHPLPVLAQIRKRIPVGGGLGGGSSDAAAMLLALCDLFSLDLPLERLQSIGTRLGSDIAFFLARPSTPHSSPLIASPPSHPAPRPAIVCGLGDAITRLPAIDWPILLIFPPFGCPTGPVYKAYDAVPVPLREQLVQHIASNAIARNRIDPGLLFNDLAEPACIVQPRLRDLISTIHRLTDRRPHVSGSGSTLVIVGSDQGDAPMLDALADTLRTHLPGVICTPARLI